MSEALARRGTTQPETNTKQPETYAWKIVKMKKGLAPSRPFLVPENDKLLLSARRLRLYTLREKQNASLSAPATAIHPLREAKCFSQLVSDGCLHSERSKMLLTARQRRPFTLREKQNASLCHRRNIIDPGAPKRK